MSILAKAECSEYLFSRLEAGAIEVATGIAPFQGFESVSFYSGGLHPG